MKVLITSVLIAAAILGIMILPGPQVHRLTGGWTMITTDSDYWIYDNLGHLRYKRTTDIIGRRISVEYDSDGKQNSVDVAE